MSFAVNLDSLDQLRAQMVARQAEDLAAFDASVRQLRNSVLKIETLANGQIVEVERRLEPAVTLPNGSNGSAVSKAAVREYLNFRRPPTFTTADLKTALKCTEPKQMENIVQLLLRDKFIERAGRGECGRACTYRLVEANGPAPDGDKTKVPDPEAKHFKLYNTVKKVETECCRAIRRAISLLPANESFDRDGLNVTLEQFIDQRTMKGWINHGTLGASMVTLREEGFIVIDGERQGGQLARYKRGEKFVGVSA